ncbi:acyltransferase family protein [Alteromonas sp. a30]|uniref:acyltransferase family protein n=1 Tax=Alteromonas sp. a30 TaxID=2730917 RepID=UPI002281C02C|nr:acyltransferase family protein [Alteromonas sp. a30]MCY7296392.1 acyltransferase family protein [Alteromonas sp. a30]
MQREYGIDYIRILLTFLVIVHHVTIVYGGAGGWYWKEAETTALYLVAFNTINQSFFMGFFFLLSGYFMRGSIEKKGTARFYKDRIIRLGVPLTVYFFIISPFTVAIADTASSASLFERTINVITRMEFEPGPLWFVQALLILTFAFGMIYRYFPNKVKSFSAVPRFPVIAAALIGIGFVTFIVRLFIPVGQTVAWLQLGYFPLYILLFIFGILAYPNQIVSTLTRNNVIPWVAISIVFICVLPFAMLYGVGEGAFEGGVNLNALFYALWEPFSACGIILGLLYVFNKKLNLPTKIGRFLSPLAYCIYIIHPPVVVAISLLLSDWVEIPLLKILANSGMSILACILVSYLILKIPRVSRVL